jgi:rhodanese-related sulfurtransferase
MVLVSRAVNQVRSLLVKILSAFARGIRRGFDLSIPSPELVGGSFTSISQLVALGSALLGRGAAMMGWRACAKRRANSGGSGLAISLTFSTIAVLTVTAGGFFYLYMDQRAQARERLEGALLRPMPDADGKSLDPNLKEASHGDRQHSPRGISTEDLEKLLEAKSRGEHSGFALLNIREKAETEIGSLPNATPIRFPDLSSSKLGLAGKTAILFCHNSNRSYETCQALAAMGIDCRFKVGGLEKWLVEKLSLTGLKDRTIADLRGLRPYRNQKALLDTPIVRYKSLQEFVTAYRSLPNLLAPMGSQRIRRNAASTHASVVGTASMYNPYRTRHKSDDVQTASGEQYDPTAWTAAIQTGLREQFGGVRYGKNYQPTFALVESDERQVIVKINDVGPLKPGRVIDLNERSMRYFDPSLQLGLIRDVKITLLPGEDWTSGPISDEQLIKLAVAQ